MSTLAGPAVSVPAALNTKQRESLIQRVSKVVEERIWDPAFPRDRWRAAVSECRGALLNGIDAAAQIVKRCPETSVILLSMHADEDYVIRGLNAGVKGYILKEAVERDLPLALEAVQKHRHFFSSAISEVLLEDYMRQLKHKRVQDSYELLTEREKEVLQLLAEARQTRMSPAC